jgi:hypothetical protein
VYVARPPFRSFAGAPKRPDFKEGGDGQQRKLPAEAASTDEYCRLSSSASHFLQRFLGETAQRLAIEGKLPANEFLFGVHLAHFLFLLGLVISM